jgi:hypothetical protein
MFSAGLITYSQAMRSGEEMGVELIRYEGKYMSFIYVEGTKACH